MRITGSQIGSVANISLDKVQKTPPKTEKEIIQATDRVELSKDVAAVEVARKRIEETPDIREEKVEALRREVENGTYRPPAEEIAKRILAEANLSKIGQK